MPQTQPLSAESFCATFTIDRQCRDKLAEAQALLSHQIPNGELGQVLDCALDALLAKLRKQKYAQADTNAPRRASTKAKPGSRHIPGSGQARGCGSGWAALYLCGQERSAVQRSCQARVSSRRAICPWRPSTVDKHSPAVLPA